jgi:hypothetical protein
MINTGKSVMVDVLHGLSPSTLAPTQRGAFPIWEEPFSFMILKVPNLSNLELPGPTCNGHGWTTLELQYPTLYKPQQRRLSRKGRVGCDIINVIVDVIFNVNRARDNINNIIVIVNKHDIEYNDSSRTASAKSSSDDSSDGDEERIVGQCVQVGRICVNENSETISGHNANQHHERQEILRICRNDVEDRAKG